MKIYLVRETTKTLSLTYRNLSVVTESARTFLRVGPKSAASPRLKMDI